MKKKINLKPKIPILLKSITYKSKPKATIGWKQSGSTATIGWTQSGSTSHTQLQPITSVDGQSIDGQLVELVIEQTNCSYSEAINALKNNNNDVVNAIIELTEV